MANNRRAGTLFFKVNGRQYDVKGNFTYNLGAPKRTPMVGPDRVHGYSEMQQVAKVEGEITDEGGLDLKSTLFLLDEAVVTLELANGKNAVFREAWYAGDGDIGTEQANVQVLIHAKSGEEITA